LSQLPHIAIPYSLESGNLQKLKATISTERETDISSFWKVVIIALMAAVTSNELDQFY
jgi:hypothetical protein